MEIGGVDIPDNYNIIYNGSGLYQDRYKLLQMRLSQSGGTLVSLYNDLVAQETSQKMLTANSDNIAYYKEKVYVREVLESGDGTQYIFIRKKDDQVTGDLDTEWLIPSTTCHLITETQYLKTIIVSVSLEKAVVESSVNDDGTVKDVVADCWKIKMYSKIPSTFSVNEDFRLVIEK